MSRPSSFVARVRDFLRGLLEKLSVGPTPREREFAPQRMCPFCGLITARHKRRCLECGKSLKPA